MGFRKIEQFLQPLSQSLSPKAAAVKGDLTLNDLVARFVGTLPGIQESHQTLPPVGHLDDGQIENRRHQGRHGEQIAQFHPGREHHRHSHRPDHHRASQVGLAKDENEQSAENQHIRQKSFRETAHTVLLFGQGVGQVDHQGDFGQLGRLDGDSGETEPAHGAVGRMAHPRNQQQGQHSQTEQQQRDGQPAQMPVIKIHGADHGDKTDGHINTLSFEEKEAVVVALHGHHRRSGIDHHHSQAAQHHRQQKNGHVKIFSLRRRLLLHLSFPPDREPVPRTAFHGLQNW